jgi:hypothetical protein
VSEQTPFEQLFRDYAAASLSGEPERVATFYAPRFIAAGPKGSAVFDNDAGFLDWLRSVHDFNEQTGMQSIQAVGVGQRELSSTHSLATVHWGAKFEKTGDQLITFDITYLIESAQGGWKILAYVSHADQEDEMRRLGLLG